MEPHRSFTTGRKNGQKKPGRPIKYDKCILFEAITYIVKTNCQWQFNRKFFCRRVLFMTGLSFGIHKESSISSIEDLGLELNNSKNFIIYRGTERNATPVEASASTRNKDLDDDLVALFNLILFVRASALDEVGSLNPESCASQSH